MPTGPGREPSYGRPARSPLQPRRQHPPLLRDGHNGWQTFTAPAGSVLDATTVGDRLYAIIRADDAVGLWTADLRPRNLTDSRQRRSSSTDGGGWREANNQAFSATKPTMIPAATGDT